MFEPQGLFPGGQELPESPFLIVDGKRMEEDLHPVKQYQKIQFECILHAEPL